IALAGGETIRARWAIGCDGAGSETRARIGAHWEDLGFRERWLVLDLIVDEDAPDYGRHTLQICDPRQPATYVCGVGQRRRIEFRIGDQDEAAAKDGAWRRLAPWFQRDHAKIERAAVYEFRSCIADHWRRGRVFLAGDAAHLTPPFMGQGLCAGFRDVANLAWKIAAVSQGADEALLDTYQTERAAHVREYIDMAVAMGRFINQTGAEALAGRAVSGDGDAAKLGMIRPALGSGLGARDGVCGRLAPHPRLSTGKRLEDAQGGRFAILTNGDFEDESAVIADSAFAPWLSEIDAKAALVRPDGYVLAIGDGGEALSELAPKLSVTT
ncbi:MAG: FAD-dependent monooxygenase, partial [Pseudomonadota bacterium]